MVETQDLQLPKQRQVKDAVRSFLDTSTAVPKSLLSGSTWQRLIVTPSWVLLAVVEQITNKMDLSRLTACTQD